MIREGLFDFFRFVPAAVEKAFPLSSTPGMTKDVKAMITNYRIWTDTVEGDSKIERFHEKRPRDVWRRNQSPRGLDEGDGQDYHEDRSSEQESH